MKGGQAPAPEALLGSQCLECTGPGDDLPAVATDTSDEASDGRGPKTRDAILVASTILAHQHQAMSPDPSRAADQPLRLLLFGATAETGSAKQRQEEPDNGREDSHSAIELMLPLEVQIRPNGFHACSIGEGLSRPEHGHVLPPPNQERALAVGSQ